MKSYLPTTKITVKGLPEEIEIRALSAKAASEISDEATAAQTSKDQKQQLRVSTLVCKHGVPEWSGESLEDIEANVAFDVLSLIAREVYVFSGVELATPEGQQVNGQDLSASKKNFETDQPASSSSG